MSFRQNPYNWLLSSARSLVLLATVVTSLYPGFKRELSKPIDFLIIAIVTADLVLSAVGAKDILLELFNRVIDA